MDGVRRCGLARMPGSDSMMMKFEQDFVQNVRRCGRRCDVRDKNNQPAAGRDGDPLEWVDDDDEGDADERAAPAGAPWPK